MTCLKCKGEMQQGYTTFVSDNGTTCIVVRDVPCSICEQCGETVFSLEVSENLERIVDNARRALAEVTVIRYTAA